MRDIYKPRWLWGIKVNARWVENRPEFPDDVRLRLELLLTVTNDMIDLRQYIREEKVASVKIVMLEELISAMNNVRYYLDSLEGWSGSVGDARRERSAIIYSIIESCRRHGIIEDVLTPLSSLNQSSD